MRQRILNFIKRPKDLVCHVGAHDTLYNPDNKKMELEVLPDRLVIRPYHEYLVEGEVFMPKSKKDKKNMDLIKFVNSIFKQMKRDLGREKKTMEVEDFSNVKIDTGECKLPKEIVEELKLLEGNLWQCLLFIQ